MRKMIILTGGSAVAAAAIVGLACSANASTSSNTGVITQNTTSYTSPSNTSVPVHTLAQGTQVDVKCYTEGQDLNGSFIWARIMHDGERS
jgi:hypothetical protein